MQGWLARRCQEVILTAMLCGAYIALEIGYRTFQYATLPYRISALLTARQPKGYIFDANTGYRYAPNLEVSWGPPSWHSYWRTNSYGHVSPFEYPTSKPPGEYRIAVVGDSYTANILNNVRWTEVLEDLLNQSIEWREHVGGNTTRVINFGVDGFGMVQLAGMVRSHVVAFEPDLTIVNFTVNAILQRIHYRAMPKASDGDVNFRPYIRSAFLSHVDWFRFSPELFAATVGRFLGVKCSLPFSAEEYLPNNFTPKFSTRDEAIVAGARAVENIIASGRVLFLHAPTYVELMSRPGLEWIGLADALQAAVPNLQIVSMQPQLVSAFDTQSQRTSKESFADFFSPDRSHYSDAGTTIYAEEVMKYLTRLASTDNVRN